MTLIAWCSKWNQIIHTKLSYKNCIEIRAPNPHHHTQTDKGDKNIIIITRWWRVLGEWRYRGVLRTQQKDSGLSVILYSKQKEKTGIHTIY